MNCSVRVADSPGPDAHNLFPNDSQLLEVYLVSKRPDKIEMIFSRLTIARQSQTWQSSPVCLSDTSTNPTLTVKSVATPDTLYNVLIA